MYYVVFDLEFNQDFFSLQKNNSSKTPAPNEIIQIGAVKLDNAFNFVDSFNSYVKPTFYEKVSPFITDLTGISSEMLQNSGYFPDIYTEFIKFTGDTDVVFCLWGTSDLKELFRNVDTHNLNSKILSRKYINIQPYVSLYFNYSVKNLLRLEHAVKALNIPLTYPFHNAYYDALYTAEILKKIYSPFMQPQIYDPLKKEKRPPGEPKKKIDAYGLIKQFEKMFAREMSEEEKSIILLAYKMGKTGQFIN